MTTTASKNKSKRTSLCDYFLTLTIEQLADMRDDPKRDEPGGTEIRAILTYDADNGFFLSAQDGGLVYSIRESNGDPVKFRTIEQAIEVLQDDLLCADVRLDLSASHAH